MERETGSRPRPFLQLSLRDGPVRMSARPGLFSAMKGLTMTTRISRNPTVAAETGLADPGGSLFQSHDRRDERIVQRRGGLRRRDPLGAFGQVLRPETSHRRRQPGQPLGQCALPPAELLTVIPLCEFGGRAAARRARMVPRPPGRRLEMPRAAPVRQPPGKKLCGAIPRGSCRRGKE